MTKTISPDHIVLRHPTMEDVVMPLTEVVKAIDEKCNADTKERHPILCQDGPYQVFSAEPGAKYIRIVSAHAKSTSRSVYCFVDYNGNIYKSASWKAPAKHIRGSVFDENYSWGKALGPYGAAYLK